MLNGRIEFTQWPNLWYTFDVRPLRGLEDYESGKEVQQQSLRPSDTLMEGLKYSDLY